jgi:hypothetical protein
MRTPLALLALLLASSARSQAPATPTPPSSPAAERSSYYHTSRNSWWGDVVSRRDINLSSDLGAVDDLCFIPPAADWVTDGAPTAINKKYLNLVWRAAYSISNAQGRYNQGGRTIGICGVNADAQMAGIGEFSNFFVGSFDDSIKSRTGFTSCLRSQDFVKGTPKYAAHGKVVSNAGIAVVETLNLLLKAKDPETVLEALGDVRVIQNSDKFRESVEALVRDKSVTAKVTIKPDGSKETLPLRVYAMRTLATIERTERSAKVLALIWHDEKEPMEIREGAIRAFSFIVEWPGPAKDSMALRPAMLKTLYPFLAPLMMINAVENDKKEEAGPKAQISELGNAAECAARLYPKELREKAKKGQPY